MAVAINTMMGATDKAMLDNYVTNTNKKINEGRVHTGENIQMNDFLKILTAQMSNQDPASPMEDKDFLAQMAQISSLQQMTNMAGDMSRLANIIGGNEATGALGKNVEIVTGDRIVQGAVRAVTKGGEPTILVDGEYFQWKQVSKVFE